MAERMGERVGGRLGAKVVESRRMAGGDINRALALRLSGGLHVFVKWNPRAPAGMFAREAEGLRWLREAGALRVPEVLAVLEDDVDGAPAGLALEWIEPGSPGPGFSERLGRGLAALHRAGAPAFGLEQDNFIGSLPQPNAPRPSWARFYAEQRLAPQLRRAREGGGLPGSTVRGLEQVIDRMEDLCGPPEPPARLHGDLWSGNLVCDDAGAPCLVDPAVYGGHREVDLAMMRLFGGFDARCFAAYDEAFPLAPGQAERVPLYQLYPLLAHVNLFGGGYAASVESALGRLAQ
jgi:fructosamine-3-kinase